MRFSVLASGSRANATFLEAGNTRLLIDCGLSAKQIEQRLLYIGIEPGSLDAILVTHEHSDHIRGASVLSRRYRLPVFANEGAAGFLDNVYGIECFQNGVPFLVGAAAVSAFSVVHDAVDPVGFVVTSEGLRFGQATDLGRVTPLVRDSLSLCNSLVIESNHYEELLRICEYPWELKQRIASSHGHLSNDAAAALLQDVIHPDLFHVVLGHISENSNTPAHALRAIKRILGPMRPRTVTCAEITAPTQLLHVTDDAPFADVANFA